MAYVELHARSAFSFLRGGSFPERLAERAAELKMPAMALCDRDGVYGAPRFFGKGREHGVRSIVGCELTMEDGFILPVLVESRTGYQNLCRLLTQAKLRGTKERSPVNWNDLAEYANGLVALFGMENGKLEAGPVPKLLAAFGKENVFVEIQRHLTRGEQRRNQALIDLARHHRLPLLATNGVLYAEPRQREVLDVFTCLRHHTQLDLAGRLLEQNAERHLKSGAEMSALFRDLPEAIDNTERLAERLEFTLENLGYQFPTFPTSGDETMEGMLRRLTYEGARRRYSARLPRKVVRQIERELELICRLGFAGYFLIVWDLVKFCEENDIMVQGRGSAANSVVCYCLRITLCDPIKYKLLFERFLSEGRNPRSWPDIDLDLPSGDRRERVIQEVYRRYGERGAAMTANVISYRGRSAAREIGKVLNFSNDVLDRFSNLFANGDFPHTLGFQEQVIKAGIAPEHPRLPAFMRLNEAMRGLPRHLGQHSGGMVICQQSLDRVVPLERASMPGRVVVQWDKDDCEDLGIVKIDLLGLGMLAAIQETLTLCSERGREVQFHKLPQDDPATYEMIRKADTIGVFQIESRAQMATLPRMKPTCFYDLVIEVAIIRPGPIQGGLMHPYLARREGKEPETYFGYDELLKPVLERTLGVPLFQEQMLGMAMALADFSGSEAEELRRALSFHRSHERMEKVQVKLRAALERKEIRPEAIEQIVNAVSSFALYGFPESHAISFAYLAYGSSWLKVHRAPEFYAALLNNQPMGFYAPATLIKDAQRRGVKFRPVCVQASQWPCVIEADGAIRLGLCMVKGLQRERAERLIAGRPYEVLGDVQSRVRLTKEEWRTLAEIGAFAVLGKHRREALWTVEDEYREDDLFPMTTASVKECPLPPMNPAERVRADYAGTSVTIGRHPMALLRASVPEAWRAVDLAHASHGTRVRIAGNVICRQRPGTAKGVVFISLEDETGIANAIVHPWVFERDRLLITQEAFLVIEGVLQARAGTQIVQAEKIEPVPHGALPGSASHDFH
uniref:Error-prone DNA polymerase n=1 Tax=uncultured Verrucomicrobiota bacterium TaxID=156588 RepID=D2DXS3_9BACT|nr:DNA polymerase III alpha subunit [uncultured Verrucomicrobiota bacterium]